MFEREFSWRLMTVGLAVWLAALTVGAGTLIAPDSTWRYRKGTSEASTPSSNWRQIGFNDSSWATGPAAFYYENQPTSRDAYTGNTALTDMYGNYTCVFLRQTFVVTNIYDFTELQMAALSDDGFIAWINGQEVARFNMPSGNIRYNGVSSPALPEPIPWWTNRLADFQTYLVPGVNVLAVQAFNSSKGSSADFIINPALYFTPRLELPAVTLLYPSAGGALRRLTEIEVGFNGPVAGVDAADLLINGQPATELEAISPSQYVFGFAQPATGVVQVAWAPGHGIHDLSSATNLFTGDGWSYLLNPAAPLHGVLISEFMASNSGKQPDSVRDELGNAPDWIELHNNTGEPVDLTGWSLTDDAAKPRKWIFPPAGLSANGYLVIFASGRNTNVNGQLHASFKLSAAPSFLGLYDPEGNALSLFSPAYPQQYADLSYGRDRLDTSLTGYFAAPTPGAPNSSRGPGFAPEVRFSRVGGTFQTSFSLSLSVNDPNSEIRYVLLATNLAYGKPAETNIPTATSRLYTGPLAVTDTVQVRARAFSRQAGVWPGPPRTESFVKISAAAADFTSDVPILLLHNLAGGSLSASAPSDDQSVVVMAFEPVNGVASLTNPPTLVSRGGFNIRGSSTAGLPQHNLALELWDEYNQDRKAEFLGLPADSDWVLFAQNSYDPSFLHNPLIHQLCRDAGRYSSRTRFAEMFLNTSGGAITYADPAGGNYFGLYTVEEKVKRGANRVAIQKLEASVTNANEISGGYLLKIDRADADERSFYDSFAQRNIVFRDPPGLEMVAPARAAQYNYITTFFSQFGLALWGSSYTNPVSGYAAYIDVPAWLDHHIFNAVAFNVDAFRLSGYFYKDAGAKLSLGPLWDFDRSMGTSKNNDTRCFNPRLWYVQATGDQGTDYFGNPSLLGVRWWQRLFTAPDFWQGWIDRWTELRRGALATEHIFAVVDDLTNQLAQAQSREISRWGSAGNVAPRAGYVSANGYAHNFPGTYAGEAAFLKRWLADRVDFLDTNFLRAPVLSAPGGAIAPGFVLTIQSSTIESNTTTYYTLDGTDPRLPGGAINPAAYSGRAPLAVTLNANARVFARNRNLAHSNPTGGVIGGNPPISSPWSGPVAATFVVSTPPLAVTEIMYHPAGGGEESDLEFLELRNVGNQVLDLAGIRFTRGIDFTFTAAGAITQLAPGQYAVLVKNPTAFLARYPGVTNVAGQYGGSLDNAGERLTLEGAFGEPILDFRYEEFWHPTTDGQGFSLAIRDDAAPFYTWTNPASWRPSAALGGSPGRADADPGGFPPVVVNEALTHTDPPQADTIELHNPTAAPADISGWFLTDNHKKPDKYRIPDNTVIPPYGFVTFDESQFNTGSGAFALSSLGEEVYLFSGDGVHLTGYRHGFEFGAQVNGVSFGRHVTSDGREHFVTQKANTLGGANAGPRVGPVGINEIMYCPPPFGPTADTQNEFIELRNFSRQPVPLYDPLFPTNTWRLDDGVKFAFPEGVILAPDAYVLVVGFDPLTDPVMLAAFRARYSLEATVPLYGPWQGSLDNAGERVGLYLPDLPNPPTDPNPGFVPYVLVEAVNYSPLAPWPGARGDGNSLQRIASAGFADDPANWSAAPPTAGLLNAEAWRADADQDGLPDEWELAHGLDPTDPSGDNGPLGDPDGDGFDNRREYLAGTSPVNRLDALRLEVEWSAGDTRVLKFNTHSGITYAIEWTQDLGVAHWTTLQENIAGTGALCSLSDSATAETIYYRLRAARNP